VGRDDRDLWIEDGRVWHLWVPKGYVAEFIWVEGPAEVYDRIRARFGEIPGPHEIKWG
jgi:hypothetical protein